MILLVNGEKKEFLGENLTINEILTMQDVKNFDMVSVQLNGSFVDNENFSSVVVGENDEIDFLFFMGGGQ